MRLGSDNDLLHKLISFQIARHPRPPITRVLRHFLHLTINNIDNNNSRVTLKVQGDPFEWP